MVSEGEDIEVFKEAVRSILEVIKSKSKPTKTYSSNIEIDLTNRTWWIDFEIKTRLPSVVQFYDDIMMLESVRDCLDLMLRREFPKRLEIRVMNSKGESVENPDYRPFLVAEILGTFVNKYIDLYGLTFVDECFKELYDELMAHVYSEKRENIVVSPLRNFELDGIEEASIGEYKIRKLTEWETKQLIALGETLGTAFSADFGEIEHVYCVWRMVKTDKRRNPVELHLPDFITVLRLLKPGAVGQGSVLHYPRIWRTSWGLSSSDQHNCRLGRKYTINKADIKSLRLLWKQFSGLRGSLPNNVKFALRWFNKSYEELDNSDRFLDLAIALEVLFGTSERLDLYVPHFIGSGKKEKLELNTTISSLRKARGAIVHSGHSAIAPELADKTEEIFRLSIKKCFRLINKISYDEIIGSIRSKILT